MQGFRQLPLKANGQSENVLDTPFTIKKFTSDEGVKISLSPGTVNQMLPSNIFQKFDIDDTGTFYVKLTVFTNGKSIVSVLIIVDNNQPTDQVPTPSSLPSRVEILIGIIKDGAIYRTISAASLILVGTQCLIVSKTPPAGPGELNYTPYFIWKVSTA